MPKVTSKRVKDEKTGVITTTYSDGRKTVDTPNYQQGGFDRVKIAADKTTETVHVPPIFKPGGATSKPVAVARIPKGTPVSAVPAMLADCVAQAEASGAMINSATGTIKLF